MTRLGAISFINTLPVFQDFSCPTGASLVYDAPAALNRAVAEGRLDVSPVSSAFYLRNWDRLVLLDDLSVSSPGSVESVLFLSRKPLDESFLDQPVIPVPDDSETSVALLAHLLREKTGHDLRPWFDIYPAGRHHEALAQHGCALIIGDNALLVHEKPLPGNTHCYDLASLWAEATGLPFVFAVWVARREWAEHHPEALEQINRLLRESRNRFFENPELLENGVKAAADRCTMTRERIRRYFTRSLTYGLDRRHLEALDRFSEIINTLDTQPREQQPRKQPERTSVPTQPGTGSQVPL